MLEGGGQILRNAAALAAITATSIRVTNIRAGRSKPGLRAQHLAGLQLVTDLCQGELVGSTIGSQEISLTPQRLGTGHHTADTKTAGSCMLLAQVKTTHAMPHLHVLTVTACIVWHAGVHGHWPQAWQSLTSVHLANLLTSDSQDVYTQMYFALCL